MMKEKPRQAYRLFIKVIDKSVPMRVDERGNKFIKTKWIEVTEINLGSIKQPNRDIIEFKFEPIIYAIDDGDNDDRDKMFKDMFRRFFK